MKEMAKAYEPKEHEEKIYQYWEDNGFFKPKINKSQKPFTIIMPPPNANEDLHIGHARFVAVEDVLVRYHRMLGRPTLWLPGADHAGIETQYVFEKKLSKEGKSRFDYDRDTLYKMIWDYVQKNRDTMQNQIRALGASCDWTREMFTLDPKIVSIVYQTFKKLYDEGHIYRGERIINYCPKCGTGYSQLEVDYEERDDELYYIDYGTITIATTRPETIFADVAVAVNPKDSRHKAKIGKAALIPLINREIPIIVDRVVKTDFGTGALKVTPAHDATDFEIGERHKLERIPVINEKGRMINVPEELEGLKPVLAREKAVEMLQIAGKLVKTEKIHHTVGACYRCKQTIEPMLSKQWFVKVEVIAKAGLEKINKKEIKFNASKYEKMAKHWLRNLKDWNISRQIVWGIQIPGWECECGEWVITEGETPNKCPKCGGSGLKRDQDTFDTWFSSGQWPFAALKANSEADYKYFYPTSVMETSYDIIPFWVIRMIMLGLFETKKIPFSDVVIHGLVRDKHGLKISKSKGNVINPLEMVDKYGSDAVRMSLLWGALIENDIALSEDNIRGQKFFGNKVWNASRFVLLNLEDYDRKTNLKKIKLTKSDQEFLAKFKVKVKKVTELIESYKLNMAAEELYNFFWHQYCDLYIEEAKNRIKENKDKISAQYTLYTVLVDSLKLLHPFMPFTTEAVWQNMDQKEALIASEWPK